ncbi:MAG: hypothetical protein H6620_10925 [Halobacteriovoraceae bacterium]|nr:hypothetical protein [Halobacteriovoraceae bacterium]
MKHVTVLTLIFCFSPLLAKTITVEYEKLKISFDDQHWTYLDSDILGEDVSVQGVGILQDVSSKERLFVRYTGLINSSNKNWLVDSCKKAASLYKEKTTLSIKKDYCLLETDKGITFLYMKPYKQNKSFFTYNMHSESQDAQKLKEIKKIVEAIK